MACKLPTPDKNLGFGSIQKFGFGFESLNEDHPESLRGKEGKEREKGTKSAHELDLQANELIRNRATIANKAF